jgi:type III secretion protein W
LGGVFALCQALTARLRIERVTSKLMQRLLGYTTTGIDSQEFQRLLEELEAGSQLSRTLIALNAIYSVFNKFPLALWFDNRTREELLHNLLVRAGELTKMEREYLQATATPETLA